MSSDREKALKRLENCGLTPAMATNIVNASTPKDVLNNPGTESLKYWNKYFSKKVFWVSRDWSEVQAALKELGFKEAIWKKPAPRGMRPLGHIDMRCLGRDVIAGTTAAPGG